MRTRNIYLLAISMWIGLSGLGVHAQTVHITEDRGGKIFEYVRQYKELREAHKRVVIDGNCLSACTLILGILPRESVCATKRGKFGFHEAWIEASDGRTVRSDAGTYELMWYYPANVRTWIQKSGGLRRKMIYTHAVRFVPKCSPSEVAAMRDRPHQLPAITVRSTSWGSALD
jgi:hypothetical protein